MRACAEQALRNMMDMYIYFLFMYVSQSNLVLPVSLSALITTVLFHISENDDVSVYVQRTSHKGAPHARSKGTGCRNQIHA